MTQNVLQFPLKKPRMAPTGHQLLPIALKYDTRNSSIVANEQYACYGAAYDDSVQEGTHNYEYKKDEEHHKILCKGQQLARAPEVLNNEACSSEEEHESKKQSGKKIEKLD